MTATLVEAPASTRSTTTTVTATEEVRVRTPRTRHLGGAVKEIVLTTVGIIGLLGITWLLCASLLGLSVIIFKSGSMSPTIPTGSAAIVRDIPASQVQVGDVITVKRPEAALPVTHRVVSVTENPAVAGGAIVVLKGDANRSNDISPYEITEAKLVIASVPEAGTVISIMRTPLFLAATTLGVALLAVWAFWPQPKSKRRATHIELREDS